MIPLLIISLAPIVLLLIYLYKRDKYEKEPIKLLIKVFIFGGLTVIPVFYIETWLGDYWDIKYNYPANKILTAAYKAFFVAASTEEFFKLLVFFIFIWKNKNFNEKFDGIIYAVYISLGFAAIENIMYVFSNGIQTGLMRAFTAVPAHAVFATSMGYFLALAKFKQNNTFVFLLASLFVPILIHGFYDFTIMSQNDLLLLLFFPFLIYIIVQALKQMKKLSDDSIFKKIR